MSDAKTAHDALMADLTKLPEPPEEGLPASPPAVPEAEQNQGPAVAPDEPKEQAVSRHGEIFNPEIHAQLPTGDPKTDSTGKFILKEHDYAGPRASTQFPQ